MDVLGHLLADNEYVEGQVSTIPDPAWLGPRMVALYRDWAGPPGLDLVAVTSGFLDRLECQAAPIGQTCLQVATALEQWSGHEYHSVQHHAEVATNAMVLTEIVRFLGETVPPQQRALLLAGSLGHDIYYDPAADIGQRFAAEAASARALDGIAMRCRLSAAEREGLTCLILATEPGFRRSLAELLHGQEYEDLPNDLRALGMNPSLASLAAVLSDADLLSSVGLTEEWHQIQVDRLQRELGRRIPPQEDLQFFDTVVGADFLSPGGRLFSPNLMRVREAVRRAGGS